MKATRRFVIIEEATDQEIASKSEAKFCPFTPDNECKKSDCMMFVSISVRDAEDPEYYYGGSLTGRCGLVNIPAQSRMFTHYPSDDAEGDNYFVGELEPDGGTMMHINKMRDGDNPNK